MEGIKLAENGLAPDFSIRLGIRKLLKVRLKECSGTSPEDSWDRIKLFLASMDRSALALNTDDANAQHYEVPAEFYGLCLGPRKKYSSCFYPSGSESLAGAEDAMLAKTCDRAQLVDGQKILELGCGWGSLSLWMAERYPRSKITAVSNSHSQRAFIEGVASQKNLKNLSVITCDMNQFSTSESFDRVVSVEMFEHMRNWRELFTRVSTWLKPEGRLFFHIFVHKNFSYPFETSGKDDWMGRHFFSGGIMPAFDLPLRFQDHLRIEEQWLVDGRHYGKTAEHWLENLDANRAEVLKIFSRSKHPSGDSAAVLVNRWRIFFMACAELWNFDQGREWFVGHYLFSKR